MNDIGNVCKISLDGVDCMIEEPMPFNKKYYSHKRNSAGVKYEIGICIRTGWIVWFNGPFPAGNPDICVARIGVVNYLEPQEKILADGGYRDGGVNFVTPTGLHNIGQRMRSLCRARHETINGRIKIFKVTDTRFRHNLNKHRMCFHTVLIITQMHIMLYDTNFEVFYNEDIGMFPEET
jgi:DDE superfamily endonuclease